MVKLIKVLVQLIIPVFIVLFFFIIIEMSKEISDIVFIACICYLLFVFLMIVLIFIFNLLSYEIVITGNCLNKELLILSRQSFGNRIGMVLVEDSISRKWYFIDAPHLETIEVDESYEFYIKGVFCTGVKLS